MALNFQGILENYVSGIYLFRVWNGEMLLASVFWLDIMVLTMTLDSEFLRVPFFYIFKERRNRINLYAIQIVF